VADALLIPGVGLVESGSDALLLPGGVVVYALPAITATIAVMESGGDSVSITAAHIGGESAPATGGGRHRKPWSALDLYGKDPGRMVTAPEPVPPEPVVARVAVAETGKDSCSVAVVAIRRASIAVHESGVDSVRVSAQVRASLAERRNAAVRLLFPNIFADPSGSLAA
jgi:hypothetical protein